jgi:hypothetical protein
MSVFSVPSSAANMEVQLVCVETASRGRHSGNGLLARDVAGVEVGVDAQVRGVNDETPVRQFAAGSTKDGLGL